MNNVIREVSIQYNDGPARHYDDPIRSPFNAVAYLKNRISNANKEHFVAIFLDARHRPIGDDIISIGTATASLVHPREVFQPAVLMGASALILAHNHPSNDVSPSNEDVDVTERIYKAGRLLGIELLDHIIWTRNGSHYSLREGKPECFANSGPNDGE